MLQCKQLVHAHLTASPQGHLLLALSGHHAAASQSSIESLTGIHVGGSAYTRLLRQAGPVYSEIQLLPTVLPAGSITDSTEVFLNEILFS